jgi:cytochrome c5
MGKKRAAVCFACHGVNGISKMEAIPHLAGQRRVYLEKSLHAYREGLTRQDPTMTAMSKPLSDTDIVNIAAYFSLQTRMNNGQTAVQEFASLERIRPIGAVATTATTPITPDVKPSQPTPAAPAPRTGEAVYTDSCAACHTTGVMSAPKLGDKAAWSERINQGLPTLLQHASEGFQAMPAKGGCATCSDEEIQAAVQYLMDHASNSE